MGALACMNRVGRRPKKAGSGCRSGSAAGQNTTNKLEAKPILPLAFGRRRPTLEYNRNPSHEPMLVF